MKKFNCDIGALGETLCKEYLENMGYEILTKNFHCAMGEIDIIAIDKETICFVEVKSRYNINYGYPIESVTLKKQRKILKIAQYYIMKNNIKDSNFRFDVVEILFNIKDNSYKISLMKDAFRLF